MAGGTILNVTALLNESAVGSYNLNGGGQANTFNVVPTGLAYFKCYHEHTRDQI